MDRQKNRTSLGGRTYGQTNRLYFKVDEQTDKETDGQTELRNCYIDTQCAKSILMKIAKAINETFT